MFIINSAFFATQQRIRKKNALLRDDFKLTTAFPNNFQGCENIPTRPIVGIKAIEFPRDSLIVNYTNWHKRVNRIRFNKTYWCINLKLLRLSKMSRNQLPDSSSSPPIRLDSFES